MIKTVLYARVSTKDQEREGYSIPAQIDLLREYALNNNLEIVKEYTDTETAKQAGRTNFNEMLKFLRKRSDVKGILVEKTDRLYRNFRDYVLLDEFSVEIHLVKEGSILSEKSKSHEKFIHGIKVLMAKNYIDNLGEEVRKGLQAKAEQGYYPSKPPHGYKRVDKKFSIIDELKAPYVQRAFALYATGHVSLERLSYQLLEEGLTYKPEKARAQKSQLEHILKNIFYTGQFKFNGRIFSGLHEPLVSREIFDAVQEAFRKDNKPLYTVNKDVFAYANIMKCGDCGCSIVGEIKKGQYVYYHCSWGKGKENCSQRKYIREADIAEQFDEVVKKIHVNNEQGEWIKAGLKLSFRDLQEFQTRKIKALQTQELQIVDRLDRLYIDKLDGVVNEEFWLVKHNQWHEQLSKIRSMIQSYQNSSDIYMKTGISIIELCNRAWDLYSSQESDQRVRLLKILLSNSTLMDGKVSYTYNEPFDLFASGLSCTKKLPRLDSNQQPFG